MSYKHSHTRKITDFLVEADVLGSPRGVKSIPEAWVLGRAARLAYSFSQRNAPGSAPFAGETPSSLPGDPERHPPRRWVVGVSHSWFNRFRRLLIRWEKKADHYMGFVQLVACLIIRRKIAPIAPKFSKQVLKSLFVMYRSAHRLHSCTG